MEIFEKLAEFSLFSQIFSTNCCCRSVDHVLKLYTVQMRLQNEVMVEFKFIGWIHNVVFLIKSIEFNFQQNVGAHSG